MSSQVLHPKGSKLSTLTARTVTDALLRHLTSPSPPALLLAYLSQAIASTLVTSRTLIVHFIFFLSGHELPSIGLLASIAEIALANPTGLELGDHLPSTLEKFSPPTHSIPDVGTSASASLKPTSSSALSTLSLFLPLLRICTFTAPSPAPTPVVDLTTRLLILLEPYPGPSLDVGLEAGSLLQTLPESLAAPLRHCLSGLMADLAISQDVAQLGIMTAPTNATATANLPATHLLSLSSGVSSLPLPHTLAFLLTYLHRSSRWTRNPEYLSEQPQPPPNHIQLIRLGPHIASDPSTFLSHLVQAAVNNWGGTYNGGAPEGVPAWLFLTEALPVLLRWWKDNPDPNWPFPVIIMLCRCVEMKADHYLGYAFDSSGNCFRYAARPCGRRQRLAVFGVRSLRGSCRR